MQKDVIDIKDIEYCESTQRYEVSDSDRLEKSKSTQSMKNINVRESRVSQRLKLNNKLSNVVNVFNDDDKNVTPEKKVSTFFEQEPY